MSVEELEQLAEFLAERVARKLSDQPQRRFLNRVEYAEVHGLGLRTVDRAIAEGRLAVERVGSRVMIPVNATIQR